MCVRRRVAHDDHGDVDVSNDNGNDHSNDGSDETMRMATPSAEVAEQHGGDDS